MVLSIEKPLDKNHYMLRKGMITLCLLCLAISAEARKLAEYEGLYEYQNNTTLIIVGGKQDRILYADINGSRYPLRPASKDVFINNADVPVQFLRDNQGVVIGYIQVEAQDKKPATLFKRIDPNVTKPQSIWSARQQGEPAKYQYTAPEERQDGIPVAESLTNEARRGLFEDMTNAIYSGQYEQTHSILIYQKDRLVFEDYFYDASPELPHQLRSATKSIIALLVGIALDQGLIDSVEQKVATFFPQYTASMAPKIKQNLTLHDLLSMQSGWACNDWDPSSPGNETTMMSSPDWIKFTLQLPASSLSPKEGSYCSANVKVLGRIVELVSDMSLPDFANKHLFSTMGINNFRWKYVLDNTNQQDFAQAWLTSRDLLKLGILIQQHGRWQKQQIVSEKWITAMTTQHSQIGDTPYGYLYWLRYVFNQQGEKVVTPQFSGNGGQKVIQLPEFDAIVVMTGGRYNQSSFSNDLLINYILPALSSD